MSETKLNWDDLRLFLAVARARGLAGAARATGKSAPTLGRRMLDLEKVCGNELFHRLPRGYELSEQGIVLFNKVAGLEETIAPLDRSSDEQHRVLIKISAGSWMTEKLCQKVSQIMDERVRFRFISTEEILDISRRETVIGIRNHRPQQTGLACRKIGQVKFATYAVDTSVFRWVQVLGKSPSALWVADQAHDIPAIEVTAPRNALDIARAGQARAVLPTFIGDSYRELARIGPRIAKLTHDQWLVAHNDERFVPEVRRTIDRVYKILRAMHRESA